jgi:voltage-gated potassium channel
MTNRTFAARSSYQLSSGRPSLPAAPPGASLEPPGRSGEGPAKGERVSWVDWFVVALAVVSLGLVIAHEMLPTYLQERPDLLRWFIVADLAICGVFAIEFLVRMRGQPSKWSYVKSRWYDVVGMVPVSHPFFRGFRLIRVVRIVVVTSRFVRATNRSFGEMLVESSLRKFRDVVVEVIGGAIMLRSLRTVEPWLVEARFAERIGEAMEHRRDDLHRMVQDAMSRLPGGKLLRLRPVRGMVSSAEIAAVQAVIDVLKSDELNRVVQQSTANILEELRQQVARQEATG